MINQAFDIYASGALALWAFLQANPVFIVIPIVAALVVNYVMEDYQAFLDLGPGGTPYNFYGYCKIVMLRLVILRNTTVPGRVPAELRGTGYFANRSIPKRAAPRPNVIGIAPHRQTEQNSTPEMFKRQHDMIKDLAREYPLLLGEGTSCFEKHGAALFVRTHVVNRTCKCSGEICHCHPSEGSYHMTLHPEDAERVILAGYGERHPLARGGWCRRFVPEGFCMIYAPQDDQDFEVVRQIILAGIYWICGNRTADEVHAKLVDSEDDVTLVGSGSDNEEKIQGHECAHSFKHIAHHVAEGAGHMIDNSGTAIMASA